MADIVFSATCSVIGSLHREYANVIALRAKSYSKILSGFMWKERCAFSHSPHETKCLACF